jgi:carboxylesterase type B
MTYPSRSWGESAGAISVALHMVLNNGNNEGLFRAAVMQSGSPGPFGDIEHGQVFYDIVVENAGCKGARDTLECLRQVPYETYKKATDDAPGIIAIRVRVNLTLSPPELAHDRLAGNCDTLVAPSRRYLLDRESSIFRSA